VIGLEFTKDMLSFIYPIEEEREQLKIHVRRLLMEGFLLKKTSLSGDAVKGHYVFRNDIIQKVLSAARCCVTVVTLYPY